MITCGGKGWECGESGKGMCSRKKTGGHCYMRRTQAAPSAYPEDKRKIESPEKCGLPGRHTALKPLPESTIPF